MRGQRGIQPVDVVPRRIIPARAGPTARRCCPCVGRADHPRSCGANFHDNSRNAQPFGSSPLVRGQQVLGFVPPGRVRIIPARAGPTQVLRITTHPMADHPRSCGANRVSQHSCSAKLGSSPLVRGQLVRLVMILTVVRIIPARAGPTPGAVVEEWCDSDHPRSCGANLHMQRIISVSGDHPRSCGANSVKQLLNRKATGSSPLVRGQRLRHGVQRPDRRIIPARAGPTFFRI